MGCSSSKPSSRHHQGIHNARPAQNSQTASSVTDPDPINAAILQICKLAAEGFQQSQDVKVIDDAIKEIRSRFPNFDQSGTARAQASGTVAGLCTVRYRKSKDVHDLRLAVSYHKTALSAIPDYVAIRGPYFLQYMGRLRELAQQETDVSLEELATLISQTEVLDILMPREYEERHDCHVLFGAVLCTKYMRSRLLSDLRSLILLIEMVYYETNTDVKYSGMGQFDVSAIEELLEIVTRMSRAPSGPAQDAGAQVVYETVAKICESREIFAGFRNMSKNDIGFLRVYADAAERSETIARDEAKKQAQAARKGKSKSLVSERSAQAREAADPGLRSLDIDPTNGRIILDLSGLMGTVFGDDLTGPMTADELADAQSRREEKSVADAIEKGQHPNPDLCQMCRFVLLLRPTEDNAGFQWRLEKWWVPFGNWHQLRLRQHCAICRLILSLIATQPGEDELHPQLAAIDSEVGGISLRLEEVVANGELVIRVEYGMKQVGRLRIAGPTNTAAALRQEWQREKTDTQQVNIDQLKEWLAHCEAEHGEACNSDHRKEDAVPFTLIDVVSNCLVSSASSARYFALSYVWGTVDMSSTVLDNYAARCQNNGLPSPAQLPATIADAMSLVSSLGERYLWVDALCIVQDDMEHKMRDIANMDRIYSHANATLVALHGTDAAAGLPGLRPNSRPPQVVETLTIDKGSKNLDRSPLPIAASEVPQDTQVTVNLIATPPPLHMAIDVAPWGTRGWTFQERLLSQRCLYFSERSVYFHCGETGGNALCEAGVNGPVRNIHDFEQMEEEYGKQKDPLITSLDNPLLGLELQASAQIRLADAFSAYSILVGEYTKRKLSDPGDITNAFTGTLASLNRSLNSTILCALPAVILDLALLWTPTGNLTRRGGKDIRAQAQSILSKGKSVEGRLLPTDWGTSEIVLGPPPGVTPFDEGVDRRFSSWSWAGWQGPTEYRIMDHMLPNEALPEPLMHGITVNLDGGELQQIPGRKQPQVKASPASNPEAISPALPNVLQFLAPVAPLTAFKLSIDRKYISVSNRTHTPSRQAVRRILDRNGRHCGLWWEQTGYKYVGRGVNLKAETMMRMVGVSVHGDASEERRGVSCVEGREPFFDGAVFPPIGNGSGLLNVLVIDDDVGHEYAERITVAKIHVGAWEDARPVETMVRLA